MLHKWKTDFPGAGEYTQRSVYLYLPESYDYEPNRHYPVLYMFDGHNVFLDSDATYGKSWGMKEYMDQTRRQLIIVAVECNHSPDHGRLREYAPFTFQAPDIGKIEGHGKETMEWLIKTLKPDIDARYRTLRDRAHTFVAGSSMGGLMSIYALFAYNEIFSGAAALSPSMWTNMTQLNRLIKESPLDSNTVLYMDYGEHELRLRSNMEKNFKKIISMLLSRDILLTSRIVPKGEHCEACWEKQIPLFMDTLLYPLEKA